MIKYRAVKIAIAASLLASSFSQTAFADPDQNFSKVNCNDEKIRGLLLEAYNDIKSRSDDPTIIDVYDQTTLKAGMNKLTCHGTYEFSDGDKLNMTFELYKNSIGQFVNSFQPD